jgi:uncharacterized metal-binding protein YceD (DUF177 family)
VHIVVEDIPARGRHARFSRGDVWAAEAAAGALDGEVSELSGLLHLVRARRQEVRVTAEATAVATRSCDRCGRPTTLSIETKEELSYLPAGGPAPSAAPEVELQDEDLEVGWYHDGVIQLADVVSELLALAVPLRVLCADAEECERVWRDNLGESGAADAQAGTEGRAPNAFAVLKGRF